MKTLFSMANDAGGPVAADILRERYGGSGVEVQVRWLPDVAIQYLLITDNDLHTQTIALTGTRNFENIRLDLASALIADQDLGVALHNGFRTAGLAVFQDVVPLLREDSTVTVTGCSLGGAAAVILSMYLLQDGFAIDQVVTFGQLKVTDAAGAERYASLPLLRFIAGHDPMPALPSGDYRHAGNEVILLDGPYIVYLTPDDPDYDRSTDLDVNLPDARLGDHGSYLERLASKEGIGIVQVPLAER